MALYPNSFKGQQRLQPGGRGERFTQDLPGYRGQKDRINRTNMKLNTSKHDILNIKYELDRRLPVLFRYGYAYGFNQIVIPKGTIVAVDPNVNYIDTDHQKAYNALTIANGGVPVKLNGITWEEAKAGADYTDDNGNAKVDPITGKVVGKDGKATNSVRAANVPVGIIMRNEYTRNDDAFNGMTPGAICTDCLVELPWFKNKAGSDSNPWGSAYGDLKPGMLVKSDANGKFIPSPLNDPNSDAFKDVKAYEKERQQVVGQVFEVSKDLVPAGSAIYAQWALTDRLNFDEMNPEQYRQNNRDGEDAVNNSPFNSDGTYPGYPYEKGYMWHDLHMISERTARGRDGLYDPRLQQEYNLTNGIPGLTDGKNAVRTVKINTNGGSIGPVNDDAVIKEGTQFIFRTLDVDVEKLVMTAKALDNEKAHESAQAVKVGDVFEKNFKVSYVDEKQGLVGLVAIKDVKGSELGDNKVVVDKTAALNELPIFFSYAKRGKSGVATNLDWEGCIGTIKVLLQK